MSEKRKIVVWIDEFAEDVERELADGAYTWEEYPDARLRAGENLGNKSLMKLASDLGVSFSVAKILEDHVRIEYDAKITKADVLCEAAKLAVVEIPAPTPDSLMTFKIDGSIGGLRKAIAGYEEGK